MPRVTDTDTDMGMGMGMGVRGMGLGLFMGRAGIEFLLEGVVGWAGERGRVYKVKGGLARLLEYLGWAGWTRFDGSLRYSWVSHALD